VKFKSALLIGLGAGYVLGTKAGKERYEQIRSTARQLMDNPGVQRLNQEVNRTVAIGKERVTDAASRKAEQASTGLAGQVGKAKEYVSAKTGKDESTPASSPAEPMATAAGTTSPAEPTAPATGTSTAQTTKAAGKQS
jgi:hypothetical protein